ncbi:MAG TPA: phosphoadenylyl-sulfate reductase [Kofleriaceae bacterium]|nr:phosphoadenylyl-sulfate reductase [Kofleriaceae bacterium]
MHITMVKKRLRSGEACRKCVQTEEMLRQRGLWDRIDEVVWAEEDDPASAGMALAQRFGVETAPFFLVTDDSGQVTAVRSALQLIREVLQPRASTGTDAGPAREGAAAAAARLADAGPEEILRWGLERYGADLVIAFSGSDDVALIDMAARSGLPFSVVVVDTGRLHPETYEFVERVRERYGIEIAVTSPDPVPLEALVRRKGLFSFYQDGHDECCAIRKVDPLRRVLAGFRAWATGQRRDQSAATRAALQVIEEDPVFSGVDGPLVKLNPLAAWSRDDLWRYLTDNDVPTNPLHGRGFASIGCAPCTRPIRPGQPEREGRWWWEDESKKECGLHAGNLEAAPPLAAGE